MEEWAKIARINYEQTIMRMVDKTKASIERARKMGQKREVEYWEARRADLKECFVRSMREWRRDGA